MLETKDVVMQFGGLIANALLDTVKQPILQIASDPSLIGDMFPCRLQAAQQLTQYSRSHEGILSRFSKLRIAGVWPG
jgi:hypothetical protein